MRNKNLASFNRPAIVSDSITRPADTTTYAANDVIATSTSAPVAQKLLLAASKAGGYGLIKSAMLFLSANQSTKLQADVFIFTAPVAMDNDNAAFTPTDAEMLTCAAVLSFYETEALLNSTDAHTDVTTNTPLVGDATSGAGGNCVYMLDGIDKIFKCAEGSRDLWWFIVPRNAYTPVSGETFTLKLDIMQDDA